MPKQWYRTLSVDNSCSTCGCAKTLRRPPSPDVSKLTHFVVARVAAKSKLMGVIHTCDVNPNRQQQQQQQQLCIACCATQLWVNQL